MLLRHQSARQPDSPYHWRQRFKGLVQLRRRSSQVAAGKPIFSPRIEAHHGPAGAVPSRLKQGLGFYRGLDKLPHEDLVFSPSRPFHPVLLYFYNGVLERLYRHRKGRQPAMLRSKGSAVCSILSLLALALDLPLLTTHGCDAFVAAVAAGIAVQVLAGRRACLRSARTFSCSDRGRECLGVQCLRAGVPARVRRNAARE